MNKLGGLRPNGFFCYKCGGKIESVVEAYDYLCNGRMYHASCSSSIEADEQVRRDYARDPNESVVDTRTEPRKKTMAEYGSSFRFCDDCGQVTRHWNAGTHELTVTPCECQKREQKVERATRARLRYQLRRERMG